MITYKLLVIIIKMFILLTTSSDESYPIQNV